MKLSMSKTHTFTRYFSIIMSLVISIVMSMFISVKGVTSDNIEPSTPLLDCIEVNQDFALIKKNMTEGVFRYSNKVKESELAQFSFHTDQFFQQYIDYASSLIEAKNPQAQRPCSISTLTLQMLAKQNNWQQGTVVSKLIAPFELLADDSNSSTLHKEKLPKEKLPGKKSKAILLIHGLTDSPFLFHDLAQYFHQQGLTVRTLLLPGHGTAASDLIDVTLEQWQQATQYGIERTLLDFDEVYLGGFSTGGALIFDYLMQRESVDKKIKGLLMWSPASKANNDLAWLAKYVDFIPFVDWIDLDADIDFAKYESFPYNAGAKVHELMSNIVGKHARKNNKMHDIPLFVVASEHDQTIDSMYTLKLIKQWQGAKGNNSEKDTLIFYGDNQKAKKVLPATVNIVSPHCVESELCQSVYDIAHTATTNAPSNPHYGVNGQYRNCGHYLSDMSMYKQCKTSAEIITGETTQKNLTVDKPLKRLTYNPYYDQMLSEIATFLKLPHRVSH